MSLMAALQVLALLGTGALVALLLFGWVVLRLSGRARGASRSMALAVACVTGYTVMLLGKGVMSRDLIIPMGQSKVFCELDCHVTFTVLHEQLSSDGQTATVSIRELFDRNTISPSRGDGQLWPGDRRFALLDNAGHRVAPLNVAPQGTGPLFAPLTPGESHVATLTFVVARGAKPAALLVEADDPISPFLIGHERSPFHSKVLLSLASNSVSAK